MGYSKVMRTVLTLPQQVVRSEVLVKLLMGRSRKDDVQKGYGIAFEYGRIYFIFFGKYSLLPY